jgi:hypothetical protein
MSAFGDKAPLRREMSAFDPRRTPDKKAFEFLGNSKSTDCAVCRSGLQTCNKHTDFELPDSLPLIFNLLIY